MNSLTAASLVLVLQLGSIVGVVVVLRRAGSAPALLAAAAATGLLVGEFGFFSATEIPTPVVAVTQSNSTQTRQACNDIVAKLREVGVIEGETVDGTVFVKASIWNQIPVQTRNGIQVCLENLAPDVSEVTIIAR